MQDTGIENLHPEELFKLATTMESLSKMKNWDTSSVTVDEVLKVKCACVHGTCDEGESNCAKCY